MRRPLERRHPPCHCESRFTHPVIASPDSSTLSLRVPIHRDEANSGRGSEIARHLFGKTLDKMKRLRLSNKVRTAFQGRSRGLTLVELVIAIALIGIIAVAFLGGLSNAIVILSVAKQHSTAESLAYSQMEYVKSLDYATNYTPEIPPEYADKGYVVTINAIDLEEDLEEGLYLQEITVIVNYGILRYNSASGGYQEVGQNITLEGYSYKVTDET